MADRDRHADSETATRARRAAQRPPLYRVVLHNDDYTTMEFVVDVLRRHFQRSPDDAVRLMLEVHHRGHAVGGVYPREIAETKVAQVSDEARERGMPLLVTAEPEPEELDRSEPDSFG